MALFLYPNGTLPSVPRGPSELLLVIDLVYPPPWGLGLLSGLRARGAALMQVLAASGGGKREEGEYSWA